MEGGGRGDGDPNDIRQGPGENVVLRALLYAVVRGGFIPARAFIACPNIAIRTAHFFNELRPTLFKGPVVPLRTLKGPLEAGGLRRRIELDAIRPCKRGEQSWYIAGEACASGGSPCTRFRGVLDGRAFCRDP